MKKIGKKILAILVTFFLLNSLIVPVQAANKVKISRISANRTTNLQLDGKGGKEKVKLTYKKGNVRLTINGKTVLNKNYKYSMEWNQPKVELIMTDVNTRDKEKDLFLAVYNLEWCGTYQELIRVTYRSGKIYIDPLLKTLKS